MNTSEQPSITEIRDPGPQPPPSERPEADARPLSALPTAANGPTLLPAAVPKPAEVRSQSPFTPVLQALPALAAKPDQLPNSSIWEVKTLSEVDLIEFMACEEVVASSWTTNVQAGLALATIRDKKYYQSQFASFPDYCRAKWDYTRRYVDMLIAAAQVCTYLRTISGLLTSARSGEVGCGNCVIPKWADREAWSGLCF